MAIAASIGVSCFVRTLSAASDSFASVTALKKATVGANS
jgi:hypothetical protein